MAAERRALALPAADADIDVVALREDPAVAAGDRAQLELRRMPPVAVSPTTSWATLPSSATAEHVVAAEPERLGGRVPLTPSAPTSTSRLDAPAVDAHATPVSSASTSVTLTPSRNVGACGGGLLEQMVVEPHALGHQDRAVRGRAVRSASRSRAGSRCGRRRARPPGRRRRAARGRRASSARRRTACRAGSAPCRRAARALPRGRDGSAVTEPAGPAPTTMASKRSTRRIVDQRG